MAFTLAARWLVVALGIAEGGEKATFWECGKEPRREHHGGQRAVGKIC